MFSKVPCLPSPAVVLYPALSPSLAQVVVPAPAQVTVLAQPSSQFTTPQTLPFVGISCRASSDKEKEGTWLRKNRSDAFPFFLHLIEKKKGHGLGKTGLTPVLSFFI